MKNFLLKLMFLAIPLGMIACSDSEDEPETPNVEVTSVTVSPESINMVIGDTERLTLTILPENASVKSGTWASSDEAVATVSQNGTVTAVAEGTAVITVTAGSKSATCNVTVTAERIEIESIEISPAEVTLTQIGETAQLTVKIMPEDATYTDMTWTSSDESIATVTQEGLVTAVAEGNATLTVSVGEISATCSVTVADESIEVESIEISPAEVTLTQIGETAQLTAQVMPEDATYTEITWTTSDESIVTVTEEGLLTAVAAGNATVTAAIGEVSATCAVTVSISIAEINGNEATVDLTGATNEQVIQAIADASAAGVTRFTFNGDYAALALGESTPFAGIPVELLDLSGVTGWPLVNGLKGIPEKAFYANDSQIQEIILPEEVQAIGSYAFYENTLLTKVTAPGVQTVIEYAFQKCSALEMADMPQLTILERCGFYGTALKEVNFQLLTSIGSMAFYNCTSLTTVSLPELTAVGEIAPTDAEKRTNTAQFSSCTALTSLSLPNATLIGDFAFDGCTALTEIELPEVTEVGLSAFRYCDALTKIRLPKATQIKGWAFDSCPSLVTVQLVAPASISVHNHAFGPANSQTLNIDLTLAQRNSYQVGRMEGIHGEVTYTWRTYEWKSVAYE